MPSIDGRSARLTFTEKLNKAAKDQLLWENVIRNECRDRDYPVTYAFRLRTTTVRPHLRRNGSGVDGVVDETLNHMSRTMHSRRYS